MINVSTTAIIICFAMKYNLLVSGYDLTTMAFLVDVLRFQGWVSPPAHVSAFLCHDLGDMQHLMKYMSEQHVSLSVHTNLQKSLRQLETTDETDHFTFITDIACPKARAFILEAQIQNKLRSWYRWILIDDLKSEKTPGRKKLNLDEMFEYFDALLDSEVIVGRRVSENKFMCFEVYRRGYDEPLVKNKIAEWEEMKGIEATAPLVTSRRRMNLHRSTLKAVMVVTNNDTLNHLNNTVHKHIDTITKVNDALFHHIVDCLNASVDMVIVNTWGYPDAYGNWSGLAGYLQRGDADIGTTGMFVTKERLPFVRYIASTSVTKNAFIFRQPPLSFVENIFTLPFNRSTWLASAGLVTLVGCIIFIVFNWEFYKNKITNGPAEELVTGSDVALLSLGAVCQQGTTLEPQSIPGRILVFVLFTTVIFLYTAYSACIVALLQSSTNSIRTLQDLLNSGLTLGVEDVVYNRHYFPAATDPIRHAIYTKKVSPPSGSDHFMSLDEGLKRVRKGLFAFHVELGPGYEVISDTFLEEEKCGLETINFLIEIVEPWVGVSKQTPMTELLSVAYRKINEYGLQHRENERFYQKKPECASRGSLFVSVGIKDCYPALLVLLYGIMLGTSVLLMEIITNKWNRKLK